MNNAENPSTAPPWWKTGIIYQIYVRSFADAGGDGIGDLPGITSHLDYLNDGTPDSLGVDAIWLTPIYESPDKDFSYDVSDYRRVHPAFGTMEDFDRLLAEAHRRGIRVILDFVPNHTSDRHPWFVESRSSRESPKRDWFIWRDGRAGKPPNNWQAVPGGTAWKFDPATGQYFYHAFLDCQPDLNWRNPDVRRAVMEDMRFWLQRGADGFRLDLVNFLLEDESLRDNPRSLAGWWMGKFQAPRYTRDLPETHQVLQEFRKLTDSFPDRMMVGEVVSYPWEPSPAADYTHARELHLAFNMELPAVTRFRGAAFRAVVDRFESRVAPDGWPAYYLSNHDIPRHLGRYGGYAIYGARPCAVPRAKVLATMLLTLRGTPILYYGEELGMTNRWWPRSRVLDPLGKKAWPLYQGRDASRTPMLWEPGPGAGFTTGRPWLPIDPEADRLCVRTQRDDPRSLWNHYRRLSWLRRQFSALLLGRYEPLDAGDPALFVYRRRTAAQSVLVALNFSDREKPVRGAEGGKLILSTHARGADPGRGFSLAPYEALVCEE